MTAVLAARRAITPRERQVIARGSRTVSAGRWALRVRVTRAGRARLRRARRVKATLVVRFAPASGIPVQREARVIVRR